MVFWGIEVKPGKPFTHDFYDSKGRLHLSMASLGLGNAAAKSVLQCNVGSKAPVLLCSLFPDKSESIQLNLEFEEADDVIFSVVGPQSIHLSGYYMTSARYSPLNEESESYGEDIADTESQRSDRSDEDDYEDSFINDGKLEVVPPSPVSNGIENGRKPRNRKGNGKKRLRKTYVLSDSADEQSSQPKHQTSAKVENDTSETKSNPNDCATSGQLIRDSDILVYPVATSTEGHKEEAQPKSRKRKERGETDKVRKAEVVSHAEDGQLPNITVDSQPAHKSEELPKKKIQKNGKKDIDTGTLSVMSNVDENGDAKEEQGSEGSKYKKKGENVENGDLDEGTKMNDALASQVPNFGNGLVIERLEPGKPDGKVAVSGKKISVRYVAMLMETGQIIESNVGKDLYRFRLGANRVIEAWDVGLEGMKIGEKRRLTVPPPLGYGSEGAGNRIPPDTWLIYEVELIKVR